MTRHRVILTALAVFGLVLSVWVASSDAERAVTFAGYVRECETDRPVSAAQVVARHRGWGFEGGRFVWDKDFTTEATTDGRGHFSLSHADAVVSLRVSKPGYLSAEQQERASPAIIVKLLPGSSAVEVTYGCRRLSECLSCRMEGRTQICENTCQK